VSWVCEKWPADSPFWDLVHYQQYALPDGQRAILMDYYGEIFLTVNRGDGTEGQSYLLDCRMKPDGSNKEAAWRKAILKARELLCINHKLVHAGLCRLQRQNDRLA
jgi:hypothetical protein